VNSFKHQCAFSQQIKKPDFWIKIYLWFNVGSRSKISFRCSLFPWDSGAGFPTMVTSGPFKGTNYVTVVTMISSHDFSFSHHFHNFPNFTTNCMPEHLQAVPVDTSWCQGSQGHVIVFYLLYSILFLSPACHSTMSQALLHYHQC
jgi:hypothetical protein